jgi:hypothetical protein
MQTVEKREQKRKKKKEKKESNVDSHFINKSIINWKNC